MSFGFCGLDCPESYLTIVYRDPKVAAILQQR
jgi:hypothetical protein